MNPKLHAPSPFPPSRLSTVCIGALIYIRQLPPVVTVREHLGLGPKP